MSTMSRRQQPKMRHGGAREGRQRSRLGRRTKLTRLALITKATVAAIAIAACSTSTRNAGPTTAVSKPAPASSSAPASVVRSRRQAARRFADVPIAARPTTRSARSTPRPPRQS
jgi:hypothetical protein